MILSETDIKKINVYKIQNGIHLYNVPKINIFKKINIFLKKVIRKWEI